MGIDKPPAQPSDAVSKVEEDADEPAQSEREIMLPPVSNGSEHTEPTSVNLTNLAGLCDDDITKLVDDLALKGENSTAAAGVAGLLRKMREFIGDEATQ